MPGGLFFGPPIKGSQPGDHTIEFHRAVAAIFPLGIMTFLVLVCLICAECISRQNRKKKDRGDKYSVSRPRAGSKPAPDLIYMSPDSTSRGELLRTPSLNNNSDDGPRPIDFSNLSFEYGEESVSKKSEVRVDLEGTYVAQRDSLQPPPSPPFGRLKDTPPGLFRKEDDELHGSCFPSPQTRQGMGFRYGAWVRTPPAPPPPSETSDSDQSTQFQMSMSDDDKKMTVEEQKAKDHKRLQREKKRLRREKKEENAAIIREQMNWTVKDEYNKRLRESRAIPIPPRPRTEERQRMARPMAEGFTRPTVLPSAWNEGSIVEFHQENPPNQAEEMASSSHSDRKERDLEVGRAQSLLFQDAVKNLEIIEGHVGIAPEALYQNYGVVSKVEGQKFGNAPEPLYQNYGSVKKVKGAERKLVGDAPEPLYQNYGSVKKVKGAERKLVGYAPEPLYQKGGTVRLLVRKDKGQEVGDAPEPLYQNYGSLKVISAERKLVGDAPKALYQKCGTVRKAKGQEVGDAPEPLYQNYDKLVAVRKKHEVKGNKAKRAVDVSQPLFHHYGAGMNYGATMRTEVHPLGTFTTGMLEENLSATWEDEMEKREKAAEARRVRAKIGQAVYSVEMARLQDEMEKQKVILERNRKRAEKDREGEPLDTEASGLTRRKPAQKVKDPNVVELVEKGLKILGLAGVPQDPSASGLVRRKSVSKVEYDDGIVLGDELSSSWEDLEPEQKYVWWAGIGDRKKKASKQKKSGRK